MCSVLYVGIIMNKNTHSHTYRHMHLDGWFDKDKQDKVIKNAISLILLPIPWGESGTNYLSNLAFMSSAHTQC